MLTIEQLQQTMLEAQKLCRRSVHEVCAVDKKAVPILLELKHDLAEYLSMHPDDVTALRYMYFVRCYLLDFQGALSFLEKVCTLSQDRKDKLNLVALKELASSLKQLDLKPEELTDLLDFLDETLKESSCDHSLRHTKDWLANHIANKKQHRAIIKGLQNSGGYCDCEVLANIENIGL